MNSLKVADSGATEWQDKAVALAIGQVRCELPEIDPQDVVAAANRCRIEVPVTGGLPLLRHRIRQRVLGFASTTRP